MNLVALLSCVAERKIERKQNKTKNKQKTNKISKLQLCTFDLLDITGNPPFFSVIVHLGPVDLCNAEVVVIHNRPVHQPVEVPFVPWEEYIAMKAEVNNRLVFGVDISVDAAQGIKAIHMLRNSAPLKHQLNAPL